jgi:hypothetical protein
MVRYALVALVLVISFVTALVVLAGAAMAPAPANANVDPFAPYAAIVPGASLDVLSAESCAYQFVSSYTSDNIIYCQIRPTSGQIQMVGVLVRNSKIERVSFTVRDMRFATVAHRWSRPTKVLRRRQNYLICWREGVFATVSSPGWFTYQATVHYVGLLSVPESDADAFGTSSPNSHFCTYNNN